MELAPSYIRAVTILRLAAVVLLSTAPLASAQNLDSVPAERLAAREWFRNAKLGMFIHWGAYSHSAKANG